MHLAGGQGSSFWFCTTENTFPNISFYQNPDKESKLKAIYSVSLCQLLQQNPYSNIKNSVTMHKTSLPFSWAGEAIPLQQHTPLESLIWLRMFYLMITQVFHFHLHQRKLLKRLEGENERKSKHLHKIINLFIHWLLYLKKKKKRKEKTISTYQG